jgi:XRE family transcriptional regulator of biofilm formation
MIGERIKKLRQQKGFSITELAQIAGVSKSYLSYIERNLQNNPSLLVLSKLASPLHTTIEFLLGTDKVMPPKKDIGLDEEWKELIQRTITEGVSSGDFEVVRSKQHNKGHGKVPKELKKTSNIIIFHIDY